MKRKPKKPAQPTLVCGLCRECCKGPRQLRIKPPKPPWQYYTYKNDGHTYLGTQPNGDCIYLTPAGCMIYSVRPDECRAFDCRDHVDHPLIQPRIQIEALKRMAPTT